MEARLSRGRGIDGYKLRSVSQLCSWQGHHGARPRVPGSSVDNVQFTGCEITVTALEARPTDKYFQWVQSNGLAALALSWKKDGLHDA